MNPALHRRVGDASSILFAVPGLSDQETDGCFDFMTVEDPADLETMAVILARSPDEWCEHWRRQVGGAHPAKTWFVTTDEYARSAAADPASTITTPDGSMRVDTVANPSNLTGLGVTITEQLDAYRSAETDRQLVFCLDSLGILLQYADTQTVFQFLHTLTGQVEAAGAIAHYHLDPAAHDDRTVSTLRPLFDATVTLDGAGDWDVHTRR